MKYLSLMVMIICIFVVKQLRGEIILISEGKVVKSLKIRVDSTAIDRIHNNGTKKPLKRHPLIPGKVAVYMDTTKLKRQTKSNQDTSKILQKMNVTVGKPVKFLKIGIDTSKQKNKYKLVNVCGDMEIMVKNGLSTLGSTFTTGYLSKKSFNLFKLTNTTTSAEIEALLTAWNVPVETAKKSSPQLLKIVRSPGFKGALLAISTCGASWALLRVNTNWSTKKIAIVTFIIMLIIIVLYLILRKLRLQS